MYLFFIYPKIFIFNLDLHYTILTKIFNAKYIKQNKKVVKFTIIYRQ